MTTQNVDSTAVNLFFAGETGARPAREKNKSKKTACCASIDVQAGSPSIFQPATGATEPCETDSGLRFSMLSPAAISGGHVSDPKENPEEKPVPGSKPCQWCDREFPATQGMRQCYLCGFRICLACVPNHRGMHNGAGGDKCSRCQYGYLLPD